MSLEFAKPGTLLKLNDPNLVCWFANSKSDSNLYRLKIGSIESFEQESKITRKYDSNFFLLYLGLDSNYRNKDFIRQLRLVYIDGKIGYIECYDIKYLIFLE
jgi:hypothetical protein